MIKFSTTLFTVIFFATTLSAGQQCGNLNDFRDAILVDLSGKVAYDQFLANCEKDRDINTFHQLTLWRLCIAAKCGDVPLIKSLDKDAVRAIGNDVCFALIEAYECPLATDEQTKADNQDTMLFAL